MPVHSRLRTLASLVLSFAALSGLSRPSPAHAMTILENWTPEAVGRTEYGSEPVWRDEFNGESLDLTKWHVLDEAWPHNSEKQYYTPNAVSVSGGTLRIRAAQEEFKGRQYTSGRIDTTQSTQFRHGLYAARIKSTYSQAVWPAWWLFGTGPKYSEIDIFEQVGGDSYLQGTGYGDDSSYSALMQYSIADRPTNNVTRNTNVRSFKVERPEKFADQFHVMWLEWTPTAVWVGLNDWQQMIMADASQLEAFNAYMFMIFNIAIGGDYPGDPDSTTVLPQTLEVDWVRVWAKGGRAEDILQHEKIDDPDVPHTPGGGKSSSSSSSSSTGGSSGGEGGNNGGSSGNNPSSGGGDSSTGATDGGSSSTPGGSDNNSTGGGGKPSGGGDGDVDPTDDNDIGAAPSLPAASLAGALLAILASFALAL